MNFPTIDPYWTQAVHDILFVSMNPHGRHKALSLFKSRCRKTVKILVTCLSVALKLNIIYKLEKSKQKLKTRHSFI